MIPPDELAAIQKRAEAALNMIAALCSPRNSPDSKDWIMSIPARDDDPDMVLAASVRDVKSLLSDNTELREAIAEKDRRIAELKACLKGTESAARYIDSICNPTTGK